MDTEGIYRDHPLSLLQIGFEGTTFVVDLHKVNPFALVPSLQPVMEDESIVKVFHDFCEDAASLVRNFGCRVA